ncbi:DNA repair protein RecN [Paenibacillus larvae]|uniref:DNA repair protein RecN n=2 Tax=Paenibacillus larvae TaxID=1464 RepID=A0AAP5JR03_9BACL|nr:DNA repair protein RecN [Paenibacillus larvae]AQR76148.1 DNA repair protein RecN [Paenibacillus larvae subsp. larvae]AVF23095.1 DNA repair protein RecN [Paenibacillus larvae subsp. larvae]ETK26229.1 DNA repair protein RecN [Paenibacillus larvae subsp. larvae DSM 25719]MCY7477133.1 DNA repair protein RecN [Paenibacillus larvae]MCY7488285.1 DNA repair protein RecN [Paenibacillus larvae]
MLTELSIRNLAVVEYVHLVFRQGFHVLTGETGAGKSMIIDALGLIVGGRSSSELVRHGCDRTEIEAVFELPVSHPVWEVLDKLGIMARTDEQLIIRRDVTAQGKSSSRINGQLVNLTMLREVGNWLVNLHGQHEHQSLLKVEEHIHQLDVYGEREIGKAKADYQKTYNIYIKLRRELSELEENSKQSLQMLDLYRFQIEEIAAAGLKEGEDLWLQDEKRKLSNAEKLYQHVAESYDLIYGGNQGLDAISGVVHKLQDITRLDARQLEPLLEQIQSAFYQLEDAAYQLRDYRDQVEFNPDRLQEIEERLDLIANLRRKYGDDVSEILEYMDKIKRELDLIENKDEVIQKVKEQLLKQEEELIHKAVRLSSVRKQVAKQLALEIESELKDLHMERTQFEIHIESVSDPKGIEVNGELLKFTREGIDEVEFLMAPNPGEPLRGLSKIASGGELSRIMLALKAIFARMEQIPVLIFDEVDTGVSGRAAQAIAEKLSYLSENCQVFSITHLPQVACMADVHFYIHKEIHDDRTFTKVEDLNENGRIRELARMLGGVEVTDTTLHHAQEMIDMAKVKKTRNV